MKIIIAALLGLALCGTAQGEMGGDDINAFCATYHGTSDKEMDVGAAMCFGYTSGVVDTPLNNVCFPDWVNLSLITFTFKKYLSDHPELHHLNARTLAHDAFEEYFPCGKLFENRGA